MTRASYSATPLLRSLVHRPQGVIHTYTGYNRFLRWWIYNRFLTVGERPASVGRQGEENQEVGISDMTKSGVIKCIRNKEFVGISNPQLLPLEVMA